MKKNQKQKPENQKIKKINKNKMLKKSKNFLKFF